MSQSAPLSWTGMAREDREAEVVRLTAAGLNARQIAEMISDCPSRSAVIGVLRRVKARTGAPVARPKGDPKPKPTPTAKPAVDRCQLPPADRSAPETPRPPVARPRKARVFADIELRPVLLDAGALRCRFPLWSGAAPAVDRQFVCGEPVIEGRPYCGDCYAFTHAGGVARPIKRSGGIPVRRVAATPVVQSPAPRAEPIARPAEAEAVDPQPVEPAPPVPPTVTEPLPIPVRAESPAVPALLVSGWRYMDKAARRDVVRGLLARGHGVEDLAAAFGIFTATVQRMAGEGTA